MKTTSTIKAGDSTWTPDGSGHGVDNSAGTEDLVFMALIGNRWLMSLTVLSNENETVKQTRLRSH